MGADQVQKIVPHGPIRGHYGTGYYIYHRFVQERSCLIHRVLERKGIRSRRSQSDRSRGEDITHLDDRSIDVGGAARPPRSLKRPCYLKALRCGPPQALGRNCPVQPASEVRHSARTRLMDRLRLRITWDRREQPVGGRALHFSSARALFSTATNAVAGQSISDQYSLQDEERFDVMLFPNAVRKVGEDRVDQRWGCSMPRVDWYTRFERSSRHAATEGYFHATYRDPQTSSAAKTSSSSTRIEGSRDWTAPSLAPPSHLFPQRRAEHAGRRPPIFFDDSLNRRKLRARHRRMGRRRRLLGRTEHDIALCWHTRSARATNRKQRTTRIRLNPLIVSFWPT